MSVKPQISGYDPQSLTTFIPRPRIQGKFLYVGHEKLYVRGVTYGTFQPDESGAEFHNPERVSHDFAQMVASGINAVRTYTVPPRWLLDAAQKHHLHVMVGLPWEQHIAFLDDHGRAEAIEERVQEGVRTCAGHPAVLCYAVGNEIPSSIVRWHGAHKIERFLKRLVDGVKCVDPEALVTYVNYPSTEYLSLPFLDLACYNVYLESKDRLAAYLARLQNLTGDRPLVMAEIGLDSRRNGMDEQARVLDWQIHTVFEGGCAGLFVFAWTDEWSRGGADIDDWDFGLTDRARQPKPALQAIERAFKDLPFPRDAAWPSISVVVCSYNGARTIADTCDGLLELDYPSYEVIVVDDGSTDDTGAIVARYGFQVIRTSNQGLSAARNVGWQCAKGEIIVYLDDDARPDPHWLTYLASTFMRSEHVGVGGPNIPPPGDGFIAHCVANAPGGPTHVLVSDEEAEHLPGCNLAFRRDALQAVDGFDPRYRAAGDDVDICWRMQARGWTLGFNPAAIVWHHRRNSIRAYWNQQVGYGRAEALLEQKWPEKYNAMGHYSWTGRLYGQGLTLPLSWRTSRVYQGSWGTAPFQSIYQVAPSTISWVPLMPEWYVLIAVLVCITGFSALYHPLLWLLPILVIALAAPVAQAVISVRRARFASGSYSFGGRLRLQSLTVVLHLLQPLARLSGRLRQGLSPWRQRSNVRFEPPRRGRASIWSEHWKAPEEWLRDLEASLQTEGISVQRGGEFDRWDLQVQTGWLGATRLLMTIEEHGSGQQLARFRWWPHYYTAALIVGNLFALLATGSGIARAWIPCAVFGMVALFVIVRSAVDVGTATAVLHEQMNPERRNDSNASPECGPPIRASFPSRFEDYGNVDM